MEAQQVWTAIASTSRSWGTRSRDFPTNPRSTKTLIRRHLAWLTVLRYQLRDRRVWESVSSVLVSWMYGSLDQAGESTENPFEGAANDVPISQISRLVEIELGEILGETDLPPVLHERNEIIL
jgi:putative membrane protein